MCVSTWRRGFRRAAPPALLSLLVLLASLLPAAATHAQTAPLTPPIQIYAG